MLSREAIEKLFNSKNNLLNDINLICDEYFIKLTCQYCEDGQYINNLNAVKLSLLSQNRICCTDCMLKLNPYHIKRLKDTRDKAIEIIGNNLISINDDKHTINFSCLECHKDNLECTFSQLAGKRVNKFSLCLCCHPAKQMKYILGDTKDAQLLRFINNVHPDLNVIKVNSEIDIIIKCNCDNLYTETLYTIKHRPSSNFCNECRQSKSRAENEIGKLLNDENVSYNREQTFQNLRNNNGKILFFDFFLYDHNILIEYDGEQHFKPVLFGRSMDPDKYFIQLQEHDALKTLWAEHHEVKLIRFNFSQLKNLKAVVLEMLNKHRVIENEYCN